MTTALSTTTSAAPFVSETGLQQRAKLRKQTAAAEEAKESVAERTREKAAGEAGAQVQLSSAASALATKVAPTPTASQAEGAKPQTGQVLNILG